MKIAYVSLVYSKDNMLGVEKKIIQEAKYYKKNGIDIIFLNRNIDGYQDNIYYKKIDNYYNKRFFEIYLRAYTFDIIEKLVDMNSYDIIYLRYPLMDFSALSFARKYGHKVITQHHGKELEEILSYKIRLPFKIVQYLNERFLAPKFFRYIYALTAISDDLLEYEKDRVDFKNKLIKFSNGIEPDKFTSNKTPKVEESFSFIMVASSYAPWHGLDRMLKSLSSYRGDLVLNFYIVGELSSEYKSLINEVNNKNVNIYTLGKLYGKELDKAFDKVHMACDSLAMYRLGMRESSTLKSKEYIARGIPFLYSAPDEDLVDVKNYLFDVKNEDSLINFEEILKFYKNLDIINMKQEMKFTTKNILSWDIKIKKLKESISC